MRKIIATGLAAALAVAAIAVPASAQTATKFSVLEVEVKEHIDREAHTVTFRDRLVEPGNRDHVLGHDEGRCTFRRQTRCRVVFFFSRGKVKINGELDFHQHLNKVPVVGGTGVYDGVGGKAIVHFGNRNTLVDFTLVK